MEKELRKLQASEKVLTERKSSQNQHESEKGDIIPTTQHILDSYDKFTVLEKNNLWKIVMERITVFRTPEGALSMHVYPKLPMPA